MRYMQTQTINISIYDNNGLSRNPITLILSSPVNFDKEESKFEKKCLSVCVCVWREGGGGGTDTKTACQTVSVEVNTEIHYLHNVEHVVKFTFRNLQTLILSSLVSEF